MKLPSKILAWFGLLSYIAVTSKVVAEDVPQWSTLEISLTSEHFYDNPYLEVEVWCNFVNDSGEHWKRPAFWDGGNSWKVRFAPPVPGGRWTWNTEASQVQDCGLHGKSGSFNAIPTTSTSDVISKGLLHISPKHRSVVHRTGEPFLMVADTAWSLPFRATPSQVEVYAKDRQSKGFNSSYLSVVQPDRGAQGPDALNTEQGFTRAFHDLKDGHINRINPEYFQALDTKVDILLAHNIVPVYAMMLHGYGWKGLSVIGNALEPKEYVRLCKYIVARYGSKPALWLLTVDGAGDGPGVRLGGEMIEQWDCYQQPTGIHYNPWDDSIAGWAKDLPDPLKYCMHGNKKFQDAPWLDFQWAQTGHSDLHQYHKVERMYDNTPTKAAANAEPTYEGMNEGKAGLGWWQGEEAWMQLTSGGTMGVAYGACSIWRWKITAEESGWDSWTEHAMSWEQALDLPGSRYVGNLGKILAPFDLTDIERRWDLADGKPLLAREGNLYIAYLNEGGRIRITGVPKGMVYRWANPKTAEVAEQTEFLGETLTAPSSAPWVLLITSP